MLLFALDSSAPLRNTDSRGRAAPVNDNPASTPGGVDDRAGKGAPDAIISGLGIMQAVPCNERGWRQPCLNRPAHQRESGKQPDVLLAGDLRNESPHHLMPGGGEHHGGIL